MERNVRWKFVGLLGCGLFAVGVLYVGYLIHRGFSSRDEPSGAERALARAVRDLSIPRAAARETNPWKAAPDNLQTARDIFRARCATCHGNDGRGRTPVGRNLYPKPPDLVLPTTQNLTDGEIHYIIQNGVRLTGMPAWGNPHEMLGDDSWKLVLFVRYLAQPNELALVHQGLPDDARYAGSAACEKCHAEIYRRWKKTPMANVVRDPKEFPDAISADLSTNTISRFSKNQVALVYGSLWKQRYFTKIADDYFPLPAQWEIKNHKWSKYMVPTGGDWWAEFYPPDNMQRPTGPLCDGCHSVAYDIHSKTVAEWNVGCERCHGPGSGHVASPTRDNILNPAHMDYVSASDTCIQCHSQGQPLSNPIEGKYYDWPVGYQAGKRLQDFWKLELHTNGEDANFYYFPDGTAHKNRMQGNDFVQSVMYTRGVSCFDCHDVHGTGNYAQLRKPVDQLCLDCHGPLSPNGPRTATLEEHTHHKEGSAGSQCVACHMPAIETEGVPNTFVHAHTFRFITPAMTERYKIPNPCNSCHTDKSVAWAQSVMKSWPERSPWRMD